jgi:hypothetical protein
MLTTLQNRQRHSKLAKIYAKGRKHHKQPRPSQRPPHLQSKHETRVLSIALKRYDTSAGYWPYRAICALADLGILSAVEYIETLFKDCYTNLKIIQNKPEYADKLPIGPFKLYEAYTEEMKYYHGIPNNISFQKLLARLQASTPQR